jgi:asparagine synthase (glutamine-hydrolysing)
MCGIAGYIAPRRPVEAESVVRAMVQAMTRRGPDSGGVLSDWHGVTLGHRRLAILDLSDAGHQPMVSDDGQVGLVFNGCIYNFRDLRAELEQAGHRFRSQCDTEVLLLGYREWGIDRLASRLRGMFAFAIWDNPSRKLYLVRDRLGVKPLVYCRQDGKIAFASTIGSLRAAGFGGNINPQAVLDLLEWGFVTEERAIYAGISKLPPATILEWQNGRTTQRRYWELPQPQEAQNISFADAVEETERLLLEAVRLRLESDVPIGVLLSGGIDSGLVCWALRELKADVTAFTVRAVDDVSDESAAAAHTARTLGIAHEMVDMPQVSFSLDQLIDAFSEPFACQSAQAMLWVSEAVKKRATVLLTGDGGDDVFLGYPFFRNAQLAQQLAGRIPAASAEVWNAAGKLVPGFGLFRRGKQFLNYATGGIGEHARANIGVPYLENRGILGDALSGLSVPQRQIPASFESGRRLLTDVVEYHHRMHFLSEFMPKVDGSTMYFSLEARAPFLDHKLWEFAAALPHNMHLQGGQLKAILREVARRRLGEDTAFRKKQGFTVPVERWLADRWSGLLENLREGTLLERNGWVRRDALRKPIQDAIDQRSVPVQLWRLLVLEHWLSKNAETFPADGPARPAALEPATPVLSVRH